MIMTMILILIIIHVTNEMENLPSDEDKKNSITKQIYKFTNSEVSIEIT